MKKKIIFSMSCIALLSILLSMVLSGIVSYYDSLEIVKKATIAESRYIQNGIALGGDEKTAEEDACKIEHDISQQTYDAICEHARLHL